MLIRLILVFLLGNAFGKIHYEYKVRDHSIKESAKHLGILYSVGWGVYYMTQTDNFKEKGSFKNYRENFGHIVFDKDEPIWNWVGHPYTGSHFYLYYRANSYSPINAFKMAFLQSALFEFFTEVYTEPVSAQDLFLTPVLGSFLGMGIEHLTLYLLNSDYMFLKVIGHILNPATLFTFYEGVSLTPSVGKKSWGMQLNASF